MVPKILTKRKNKCSLCNAIGHNKKNCPTNSNDEQNVVARAVRAKKLPAKLAIPSLDEIDDEEEELNDIQSVGTIGNAGQSVQEENNGGKHLGL